MKSPAKPKMRLKKLIRLGLRPMIKGETNKANFLYTPSKKAF
tara:strand:- start:316 stop:441 length:126 start_codon:yes stop_codon:yes gene_type:complete